LRHLIAKFPRGALQFEVGIQSFNPEVSRLISRRQDYGKLTDNLQFLRSQTGVHVHADLIAGLPGETVESFAAGFDRLVALRPQEIQVGVLKRLRGTPIIHHDAEWEMIYSPDPPYEILQNKLVSFAAMQQMRRFARFWDLVGNSGNFMETTPLIWSGMPSPFAAFMRWSDWLFARIGRKSGIALPRLMELLFEFLTVESGLSRNVVASALWRDYRRGGRSDKPKFLRDYITEIEPPVERRSVATGLKRQNRHRAKDGRERPAVPRPEALR
jgi:hypothetical protein